MSASGLVTDPTSFYAQMPKLEDAEKEIKEIADWANLTDLKKLRAASTETIFSLGTFHSSVTGKRNRLAGGAVSAFIDGYSLTQSFDQAAVDGTLAEVPYMIGYTLNDMGGMDTSIAEFCLNREEKGGKAYAYQFARPLPTDGRPNVLRGAFHSSDLWYVFKSLKHCWRPWTQGDWDLSEFMQTQWVNFAKYGDPNGPDGGEWTPYTKSDSRFMVFKLNEADEVDASMGQPLVL
jgi:para-nitrobenzyl esterase